MVGVAASGQKRFGWPIHALPRTGYRGDIAGLRALAVVPVVLFHADLPGFSGGFVGVDVFFVVSGFLITHLIAQDAWAGRFSLVRFYERRIRRLFPALFAMLCAVLIAGALLFLPADFRSLGRNAVGATLFVSNIFFWQQSDYFDGPAETKPLLHTWSLSVEEQFYILFPLLLIVVLRSGRRAAILAIGVAALLSFVGSVAAVAVDQSTAFYLLPFRVWELLLGSLLALGAFPALESRAAREVAAGAGFALILVAATLFSDMTLFPGVAALLPCAGAALIIHSGSAGPLSGIGRLLASPAPVFVGAISYSLYLWHWPLFVFAEYYQIHALTTAQSLGLVGASFALAALSWRFIEMPFRKPSHVVGGTPLFAAAGTAMLCTVLVGTAVYVREGMPQRFHPRVASLSGYASSANPLSDRCEAVEVQLDPESPCTIGDPSRATLFLLGDSHAGALFGAFQRIAEDGPSTRYGATPRCPPLLDVGTSQACIDANRRKLDYVLGHPEIESVVVAARWSLYLHGRAVNLGPAETNGNLPVLQTVDGEMLEQFSPKAREAFRASLKAMIDRLLKAGKRVVLVYPVPEMGYDVPSTLARMSSHGEDPARFTMPTAAYFERQRDARHLLDSIGEHSNLVRLRPRRVICRGPRCRTNIDGQPLYFDSHHLSIPGARLLEPAFRRALALPSPNGARAIRAEPTRHKA